MLALAMIGLIIIGLMGVAAVVFFTSQTRDQSALLPPSPTLLQPTFTPTPTFTPIPPTPTDTPEPTPTGTPVVRVEGQDAAAPIPQEEPTVDPQATPTNTLVLQAPSATPVPAAATAPPEVMPPGGGVLSSTKPGPLIWAGITVLFMLILGVFSYLRSSS